jgi:hypothetical protein
MLKVNVGLSRKLTQDYNSTGFSINLEGEVTAPLNDAQSVVNGIKELYDLAEEALDLQVERFRSDSAITSHDEPVRQTQPRTNGHVSNSNGSQNGHASSNGSVRSNQTPTQSSNGQSSNGQGEHATQKQMNYLLSLGKRHQLSTIALEHRIQELLGQPVGIYELTKREAAQVIDALANTPVGTVQ